MHNLSLDNEVMIEMVDKERGNFKLRGKRIAKSYNDNNNIQNKQ